MAQAPSILVVDNDPISASLIDDLTSTMGFAPIYRASGIVDGWRSFGRDKPDVVFFDLGAGGGRDGLDLVRRLRDPALSDNPLVAVIAMTARSDAAHVIAARDAGCTEFLAKPFTPKAIFQRLLELVERPRPFVVLPGFFGPDRRRVTRAYRGDDRRTSTAMPAPGVQLGGVDPSFRRTLRDRGAEGNLT